MTQEEAIKTLEKSMECHDRKVCGITEDCDECPLYVDKDMEYEAYKVLLEHFKREHCEDAVSRAEVLNLVRFNAFHVKSQIKAIENTPSVTSTRKKGHWIEGEVWEDTDGGWGRWQKCSVCRQSKHHKTNFCPNCGAEMERE